MRLTTFIRPEKTEKAKERMISFRLQESVIKRLDQIVDEYGFRSRSTLIRRLLGQAVRTEEQERGMDGPDMKFKIKLRERTQRKEAPVERREEGVFSSGEYTLKRENVYIVSPERSLVADDVRITNSQGQVEDYFTYFALAFDLGLIRKERTVSIKISKGKLVFEAI